MFPLVESGYLQFQPFVIIHFNTIITAFVTGMMNQDETTWLARQLCTLSCNCADHSQLSPVLSFIK